MTSPVAAGLPVGTRVSWNTCPAGSWLGTVTGHTPLKARVVWDHSPGVGSAVYPLHLDKIPSDGEASS